MTGNEILVIPVFERSEESVYKFISYSEATGIKSINIEDVVKIAGTLVVLNFENALLRCGITELPIASKIIDIEMFAKYFYGHPAKEFKKELPWSIYKLLEDFYPDETELVDICNHINALKAKRSISEGDLSTFVQRIANKYHSIKISLTQRGDWERFDQVEIPIYRLFLERTLKGISIDNQKVNQSLEEIDSAHYDMLAELREKYGYRSADITGNSFVKYLIEIKKIDFNNEEDDLYNFLKSRRHLSPEYHLMLNLLKNKRTKKALLNIHMYSDGKIHPKFDVSGTVTSRVLMNSPNLQNVRKECRGVISPTEGKTFLYLDYSCFEPSILAEVSGDSSLIQLCGVGDMYNEIAVQAGCTRDQRKIFKTFFLAYSFGMEREGLEKFIAEMLNIEVVEASKLYEKIFEKFDGVRKWKESVWQLTLDNGYSTSLNGNRRYRNISKNLDILRPVEKRWAVNQVIQGTASLILKKAILKLNAVYGSDLEFILPMHDAMLFQGDSDFFSTQKNNISKIMQEAFGDFFKRVVVKVSEEPFHKIGNIY